MGRINDYMDGRNEGMLFALKIVKKKGIEELEHEVKLRSLTNLPSKVDRKALELCTNNIKQMTIDTITILCVATLHDQFGFGEKRCLQFLDRFNLKAECIGDDICTWQDYIDTIKDELKIEMNIRKNDKNVVVK